MQNKIKYLEMIEAVIERMARNSFQLKEWTMILVAAVCGFASQGSDKRFIILSFIPILGFWMLDSFYVQQERKYKYLYKNATKITCDDKVNFNLDTSNLELTVDEKKRLKPLNCIFSISELWFYPVLAIALALLVFKLKIF